MGMFDQPQAGGMMGGMPNASSLMGMGGGGMMDPRMLQLLQLIQNHAAQQGQGLPGGMQQGMPQGMPQGMMPGGMPQGMPPGGMQQGMQQGMMNPLMIARLRALMGQGQMGQGQMGQQMGQGSPMMGAPPAPGTFFGR